MKYNLADPQEQAQAFVYLSKIAEEGLSVEIVRKSGRRTLTQNSALHLLFTQLAEDLNNQGLDQKKVLKESVDIPWQLESVKQFLWAPIQKAIVGTDSTTELTTKEIDEVFAVLQRHLNQQLNISINFPSIETLLIEQRGY